ncbi:hypothetical protein EDD18DRAFT_1079270, partial [Armillaria luteobubalina]
HPVSYNSPRITSRDDVLPLSKPIVTRSGKVLHELPIPEGTCIIISIAGCNRNKDVFGAGAHTFNPEMARQQWMYGNLYVLRSCFATEMLVGTYLFRFTFLGGPQSCIGWRFAYVCQFLLMYHIPSHFSTVCRNYRLLLCRLLTNLSFP